MLKYSISAVIISSIVTVIGILIFGTYGVPTVIGSVGVTSLIIDIWIGRSERRILTVSEKLKIILVYGLIMIALHLIPLFAYEERTEWGTRYTIIISLCYPLLMSAFLSQSGIRNAIKKQHDN